MSKGVVIGSYYDSSFGNKLEIKYWDGSVSWYGHLSKRLVSDGDRPSCRATSSGSSATPATRSGRTCTSRSTTNGDDNPIDPSPG